MIVVDTSAVMAVALREPDHEAVVNLLLRSRRPQMAAPSSFELRLALQKKGGHHAALDADTILAELKIFVAPWTAEHVPIAQDALRRFGGRPARLNFGDCMAYALAKSLDAPLLFKGDDFRHTDITPAL